MVVLQLVPGHIHQAVSISGAVAKVWPTPWPDRWHVSVLGYPPQATDEPIPGNEVETLLDPWGFSPEGWWAHWPGPLHEVNPTIDR